MAVGVQKAWSVTASANGNSDANANWAEGMLAPGINNSARANMAAIKGWANQIQGGCSCGGSGNAYTITSDAVAAISTAYGAGMMFMLKANHTNSGAATLNVDGVGAVSITTSDGGALVAGDITSGGLYLLAYNTTGPRFDLIGTFNSGSFQPLDATLTAIAALDFSVAGSMLYSTAADTFSLLTSTVAGRALLTAADAAAQRTALSLVIGTNVQAYSAVLAAVAGLTITTGDVIVGTGPNTVATSGSTSAGRSLWSFTDPNVDQGIFWDDSAGGLTGWTPGTGLSFSGTNLNLSSALLIYNGITPSANVQTMLGSANNAAIRSNIGAVNIAGDQMTGDLGILAAPSTLNQTSVGFRGLGAKTLRGGDFSFALQNAGQLQYCTAGLVATIPPNSSIAFPVDNTVIPIMNISGGDITVVEDSGVTLYRFDGVVGTGTRTIPNRGFATIIKFDTNLWAITGTFS